MVLQGQRSRAAEAAQTAAARHGHPLPAHVAAAVAAAVLAHHDDVAHVQERMHRQVWENADELEYLREAMRRDLYGMVADKGYLPTAPPSESVSYRKGFEGTEVPADLAAAGTADWDFVVVRLSMPTRRPATE